jgi:hypothetical protein
MAGYSMFRHIGTDVDIYFIAITPDYDKISIAAHSEQKAENIIVAPPYCQTECCVFALLSKFRLYLYVFQKFVDGRLESFLFSDIVK